VIVVSRLPQDDWEEPQLKYERMANDVTEILKRDAASCIALHSKVPHAFCYTVFVPYRIKQTL